MFLFHLGEKTFPDKSRNEWISVLAFCTGALAGIFGHEGVRSLVIDWEIRGFMKGWSDRTVKVVTFFVSRIDFARHIGWGNFPVAVYRMQLGCD